MKHYWTSFLSLFLLLALASCGSEQFGATPQAKSTKAESIKSFEQASCSNHTLVKPAVDILYVVDNSASMHWINDSVKNSIQETIKSISNEFDYRIVVTPLFNTAQAEEDYQVLSKSPMDSQFNNKKVRSYTEFNLFESSSAVSNEKEKGLLRVQDFLTVHSTNGLFRNKAYLFVVLISNGRDEEIEISKGLGNGEVTQNSEIYKERKTALLGLKNFFESQQFRLFSLTASRNQCKEGYLSSRLSYMQMSKDLYYDHTPLLTDQTKTWPDTYDLCESNISNVFTSVNKTIKQNIVPHTYNYWPITFTNGPFDKSKIRVFKSSPKSPPVQLTTGWTYKSNPGSTNTRIEPSPGEPTTAPHLIEFSTGNFITYPDCVSITSTSNLEYFGYLALPKKPRIETVEIKINGKVVPQGTNGWRLMEAEGYQTMNIKVAHNGYPNTPIVMGSGWMLKLGSEHYYKSGDNVEIYYLPAAVD